MWSATLHTRVMVKGEPSGAIGSTEQACLLSLAWSTIITQAHGKPPPALTLVDYPPALRQLGASFVTLTQDTTLRGCCGSLDQHRPLAEDVAENARTTAFHDPRFQPVSPDELARLELAISVLSATTVLEATCQTELLTQLQPGRHGLIISQGQRRATFLPQVWQSIPDAKEFLHQLQRKGNFPVGQWPSDMVAKCYTVTHFNAGYPLP